MVGITFGLCITNSEILYLEASLSERVTLLGRGIWIALNNPSLIQATSPVKKILPSSCNFLIDLISTIIIQLFLDCIQFSKSYIKYLIYNCLPAFVLSCTGRTLFMKKGIDGLMEKKKKKSRTLFFFKRGAR